MAGCSFERKQREYAKSHDMDLVALCVDDKDARIEFFGPVSHKHAKLVKELFYRISRERAAEHNKSKAS